METEGNTITFRLPPETHRRLILQAEQAGISKHALARTLVIRAFDAADLTELTTMLAAVENELTVLRTALGRGVEAILQNVTDLEEDAIREWITKRILRDPAGENERVDDRRVG